MPHSSWRPERSQTSGVSNFQGWLYTNQHQLGSYTKAIQWSLHTSVSLAFLSGFPPSSNYTKTLRKAMLNIYTGAIDSSLTSLNAWTMGCSRCESLIRPREMNPNFSILRISLYSVVCFGLEVLTSSKYQFLSDLSRLFRVQGSY